jgi:hypothetical protein
VAFVAVKILSAPRNVADHTGCMIRRLKDLLTGYHLHYVNFETPVAIT